MKLRHRGFSLVELSVTLAIVGVVGLLLWRLLPVARDAAQGALPAEQLRQAQSAIEGFVTLNHRLPCPADDASGQENCAGGAAGRTPWRTLGLSRAYGNLRYGVYRSGGGDLAQAQARQTPLLPPGYSATVVNGLDFCVNLKVLARSASGAGLTAAGLDAAYALAHPGVNGAFEGLNVTGFDLPGKAATSNYDDSVAAAGMSELSGRLGCPGVLAMANVAARSAYASYDIHRGAQLFVDYRTFAYATKVANTKFAGANLGIATLGLVSATAKVVSAVAVAANSLGVGIGTVLAAVYGIGGAVAVEVIAGAQLGLAVVGEAKALAQMNASSALANQTAVDLVQAGANAVAIDNKGFNQ